MPTFGIKRDLFGPNRSTRYTHRFGETLTRDDPLGVQTYQVPFPVSPKALGDQVKGRSQSCGPGDAPTGWIPKMSPVTKPNGTFATLDGNPAEQPSEVLGRPIPVGTKRRYGPPKTDK